MKKVDPYLKTVLDNFAANYFKNRDNAFVGLDFEKLRTELAEIRDCALERSRELREQFCQQAERHGSKVILAKDSAEANQEALKILKKHGVKKLVKTKSMVSEETRFNDFIIAQGIEVRETDLGEWIIQLDEDHPTHMVLPAIHLTRKEVAKIFSDKLGRPIPEDTPFLVRTAREDLRKEIFEAGAGLTGANALIADLGAIMLVTNEGNGRLVSTIPPVHIVFTSLEKIYPGLREALAMLRLLPKNATGQVITSYVSFIAGPHSSSQYIILVDNHRSELAADPVFKPVARCIKCSACLNICPVYRMLGGKQFAHIYMGGIGTLLTAWIHGLSESRELAGLCLGCHRCDEICAVKIPISDLIRDLRGKLNQELGKPLLKELIFDGVIGHPALHQSMFKFARSARAVTAKDDFVRKLPGSLRKYDQFRSLPAPAPASLQSLFKDFKSKKEKVEKGAVQIYAGCLVEHFYPEIGIAAAKVFDLLGYDVELIEAGCCGFPATNAGFPEAGEKALAQVLEKTSLGWPVITLCPTCETMLKSGGKELAERVAGFGRFVFENDFAKIRELVSNSNLRLAYHESCHLKHHLHASEPSRQLLRLVAGKNFLELKNADSCCGFAGSFSMDYPELSEALLSEKLASIKESNANLVALDCPGCLLQIRGGCHSGNLEVRVKHLSEILAEMMKE